MSETRKWIKTHLRRAQSDCNRGNCDTAEAELKTIIERINAEMQILRNAAVTEDMKQVANLFRQVSELRDFSREAHLKIQFVKEQKERLKKFQSIVKGFQKYKIIDTIKNNRKVFEDFRDKNRTIKEELRYVQVLRRWNSYTPLLCLDTVENIGGGYFLSLDGVGIVIDPGINFIRNAFVAGLSLKDIDTVILTHSHVDHTSDFEGLVTLFHEMNETRYDMGLGPIQFSLYTSIGAVNKFCNLISFSYDLFREIKVINPQSLYQLSSSVSMKTTSCSHNDLFCSHPASCVGLKFYCGKNPRPIFGITSDTGYNSKLKEEFADLQGHPVILHIGGVKEKEIEFLPPPVFPIYKHHLGLRGVLNFVFDVKPSAAIISEFGEELKESRMSITALLQKEFGDNTKIVPADVGFTLKFTKRKPYVFVPCDICHKDRPIEQMEAKQGKKDKRITYICAKCSRNKK